MENTIYITGHRNPDTDTISATLCYAYLKQALGQKVTPIRLGELNAETRYVLNRFGIKEPELKYDIKPTVKDIAFDDPIIALNDEPIKDVWHKMLINQKKSAAVVSEEGKLVGIATISDVTEALLSLSTGNYQYLQVTSLKNIALAVEGTVVYDSGTYNPSGKVTITTSAPDDALDQDYHAGIALTSGKAANQLRMIEAGVALVIATKSTTVEESVRKAAVAKGTCIITTGKDLISVTQSITQAIPIGLVMTEKLITFNLYDYLEDVIEIITKSRFRQYPIVDNNHRIVGFISRYHLFNASKKQVILVDHNELSQSIEGIETADIIEIIDHHRLGDISTDLPVYFRNEICGSSSTIISELFEEKGVAIPKDYAGLMLSAIISDTMNFHSPTCTDKDYHQAVKLAGISGQNLEELGETLMKISASLESKNADEIVNTDIKEFKINSYKLAIGQVNIQNKNDLLKVKESVASYMDSYGLANRLDMVCMLFSLIDGSGSYLVVVGRDGNLLIEAFSAYQQEDGELLFLPSIVSRKQQVIPIIAKYLQAHKPTNRN